MGFQDWWRPTNGDARDVYRWWRKRAVFYTVLVLALGWIGLQLKSAAIEYRSRYDKEFHDASTQKVQAQDAMRLVCNSQPVGYKTVVLDCDKARLLSTSSPESVAHEVAWKHMIDDHLSIGSILGNCHEGQCSGMLYRFGEALLNNIRLLLTLVVVAFVVFGGLLLFMLVKCWSSRREMIKVLGWTAKNPTNQAQTKFIDGMQSSLESARMLRASVGDVRETAVNLAEAYLREHKAHESEEVHVDTMVHTSATPTPRKHANTMPAPRKGYRMSDTA